jgi:hypothetical protein
MDESAGHDRRIWSARELVDLALDFAERAQAEEAALIAEFRERAAGLAEDVGPVVVENDEDERVILRSDGVLAGEVLDDATGSWLQVESPEEVASYYDPTDLFLDLADALVERFPELGPEFPQLDAAEEWPEAAGTSAVGRPDAGPSAAGQPAAASPSALPWDVDAPTPSAARPPAAGSSPGPAAATPPNDDAPATDEMLENLHRSGVLSDEQYARLRRQFGR